MGQLVRQFFLAALALAGCKSDPSGKERPSAAEASGSVVVDDDYRFRLRSPTDEWSVLGPEAARELAPDAVAAVRLPGELTGIVVVERAPGVDLDAYAQLLLDRLGVRDKTVTRFEPMRFRDLPALTYRLQGIHSGVPSSFAGMLAVRDDFVYQLVAWRSGGVIDEQRFESFLQAFELTEGKVAARVVEQPVVDRIGVGWRIRDGVFESAVTGLRVRAPRWWRLVVGTELRQINDNAEVALVKSDPQVFVLAVSERAPGIDPATLDAELTAQTRAGIGAVDEGIPTEARALGRKRPGMQLRSAKGMPLEYLVVNAYEGDWSHQLMAWHLESLGAAAREAAREGLAAFELLGAEERAVLARELRGSSREQADVALDMAVRDGVVLDFRYRLRWTMPEGFWRVAIGDEARALNPGARFYFRGLEHSIHGTVLAEETALSARDYHEKVVESWRASSGFVDTRSAAASKLGHADALLSDGTVKVAGVELYYRVVTAVRKDVAVQMHIWAPVLGSPDAARWIDRAMVNLSFHDLEMINADAQSLTDRRLGYQLQVPAGFSRRDVTPPGLRAVASWHEWRHTGQVIALMASVVSDEESRLEAQQAAVQRLVREQHSTLTEGEPRRAKARVSGLEAEHWSWASPTGRLDVVFFASRGTLYVLTSLQVGEASATAASIEELSRGLVLL